MDGSIGGAMNKRALTLNSGVSDIAVSDGGVPDPLCQDRCRLF